MPFMLIWVLLSKVRLKFRSLEIVFLCFHNDLFFSKSAYLDKEDLEPEWLLFFFFMLCV